MMSTHDMEEVAVIPVAVIPLGIRFSTLSMEVHRQNHLSIGTGSKRYLVVHPTYSLTPNLYKRHMLLEVLGVLLELVVFLIMLLGLCTPCVTVRKTKYFAMLGGHGGSTSNLPGQNASLAASSALVIVVFVLSLIFCTVLACCVRLDQNARVSEELFNRELLELYGAQVHDDGRVYSANGEPSVLNKEGMWGPCCGFEANEMSRRVRNAGILCFQCILVGVSLMLQGVGVYHMKWMYKTAVASGEEATYESGFSVTVFAVMLRVGQLLFACYVLRHMLRASSYGGMPRCQLIHVPDGRPVGTLSTHEAASAGDRPADGDSEIDHPSKPQHSTADRERDREMELIPSSHPTLNSCS
ncbi:hypothetical protein, unknown function [Leishmania tarentolae]|uniref:Uncharacterized protein n=1 Tax=Leishmania tarentolae TaxID=5689 RepID=A0A640KLE0_LEITA|nr:hypothetical protein, unknown function [Leishmania tarentolae]